MNKFFFKKYSNPLLLVFGVMILGVSDNLLISISDDIGLAQFHFIRSLISIFFLLILSYFTGFSLKPINFKGVFLRTFFIVISMILFFGSIPIVTAAGAGAGLFTSPIFVVFFSIIFFKKMPNLLNITAILIGSIGVWLVLNPWSEGFIIVNFLPILSGAFYAIGVMLTKQNCSKESPLALILSFFIFIGLIGLVFSIILSKTNIENDNVKFFIRGWEEIKYLYLIIITLMSSLTIIGIWMMTIAYQSEETSFLAPYEYMYLISASFSGWYFWNISFSLKNLLGILLIFSAGLIVSKSRL